MAHEPVADVVAPARLVASGITKDYGHRRVLEVLDLALPAGSIVAVVGPNGAGKSTLLGRLAGCIRGAGHVTLDGRPVAPDRQGRVAYLPQRVRLPAAATVEEALALFSAIRAPGPDRVTLPPNFLAADAELIGSLSGGQARRVALAATLGGSPDLLLLDEPFANLDDDARRMTSELLAAHCGGGAVVIVASPTAIELLALADRVLVIEDGRVTGDLPAATYLARLEVSVWVSVDGLPGSDPEALRRLPHVVRARMEGQWMVLDCLESRSVDLLRAIEVWGIDPERVRLGGPVATSPTGSSPDRETAR